MVFGVGLMHGWWWGLLQCCWSSIAVCGNLGKVSVQAAGKASVKAAKHATVKVNKYVKQAEGQNNRSRIAEQLSSDSEAASEAAVLPSGKQKKGVLETLFVVTFRIVIDHMYKQAEQGGYAEIIFACMAFVHLGRMAMLRQCPLRVQQHALFNLNICCLGTQLVPRFCGLCTQ